MAYWRRSIKILSIMLLLEGCSSPSVRAPVVDAAPIPNYRIQRHVVAPGETVYSIAWRYDMDYHYLSKINDLGPGHHIRPGQVLALSRGPQNKAVAASRPSPPTPAAPPKTPAKTPKPASVPAVEPAPRLTNQTPTASTTPDKVPHSEEPRWAWPIDGPVISNFSSNGGLNKGIDIRGKLGEPVLAAADGEVVYSGSGLRGYGKLLIVKHNEQYLSAYAYNHELHAVEGQRVRAGQKIAEVGMYNANTAKLHFEIRYDGKPVNPLDLLPER